ncbi:exodeoxyribonuclease V subunit beta [Pseudoalteromonas sp. NBT06-2]|uniref:exodeoxyribonuclease V subunit beta n=1 Tax=Pseudoalteromonas sp. NBT06-2 TaxID=2025950 RepID=UPI000BA67484|nr:exodeoxyribonuclease V subunit beta [Pseudoalteromonas sp. NBT06-2]PAJ74728.1 exodeoxyribonuclease V subunit beta [Pseudoalteromonas sp. NBT06-2]
MQELNPISMPLDGHNLIEASAGTGKTYTITALYLRYLLGLQIDGVKSEPLTLEQILVVTFTEAATSEIKDRVRNRLIVARDALLGEKCDDEAVNTIIAPMDEEQRKQAFALLDAGAKSMDDAAIFTIHGFCQRMLKQHAFESGVTFNLDFVLDQTELLNEALKDFWRGFVYPLNMEKTQAVLDIYPVPESLYKKVYSILSKQAADIVPQYQLEQLWQLKKEYCEQLIEFKKVFLASSFSADILESGIKKTNIAVKENSLTALCDFCMSDHDKLEIGSKKQGFEIWAQERLSDLKIYKKGAVVFEHALLPLFTKLADLEKHIKHGLPIAIATQAADWIKQVLITKKQDQGIISPDDLLTYLHKALTSNSGEALAKKIASCYPVAMIDEFQDTDPIQYGIFNTIFSQPSALNSGNSTAALTMIGDPKQAIYGFRGADIFTYIDAKNGVDDLRQFTLKKNYRSATAIVENINSLFSNNQNSFIYNKNIPFVEVAAQGKSVDKSLIIEDEDFTSFEFCIFKSDEKVTSKANGQQALASAFAKKISHLLTLSAQGKARIGEKPIQAADISVLVRDRREAHAIKTALTKREISSVYLARDSIFSSQLSEHLLNFLTALHGGYDEALYRGVLAGPLFGLNYQQIFDLTQNQQEQSFNSENECIQKSSKSWQDYLELFALLLETWQKKGAMAMLELLLKTNNLAGLWQALGYPIERWLTDFRHLSELLQQKQLELEGNMRLLRWFNEKVSQHETDSTQLRLESDATLVKIVTMHASKGLEYPLVYIPFAASYRKAIEAVYHDDKNNLIYDLENNPDNLVTAEKERLAEDLRLLYVALTRAVHYCCLGLYNLAEGKSRSKSGIHHTALGYLLFANEQIETASDWHQVLAKFVENNADMSMNFIELEGDEKGDRVNYSINTTSDDETTFSEQSVKIFKGYIERDWRITSFSGLTYNQSHQTDNYIEDDITPGFEDERHELDWNPIDEEPTLDVFSFPKGAKPGSCLHGIFEEINFQSPHEHAIDSDKNLNNVVTGQLTKYGIDDDTWHDVTVNWVEQVLDCSLEQNESTQGLSLTSLSAEQCLIEMEFYLPLGQLTAQGVNKALLAVSEQEYHPISFGKIQGMLKGFIDLIFEYSGQYFILDYKSNHLGENSDDYCDENMQQVMASHHYHLQYLLYSVALHRLLKQRLPDYDINTHLGGVYYVFLRGMPSGKGIFYKKISTEVILELDDMFNLSTEKFESEGNITC